MVKTPSLFQDEGSQGSSAAWVGKFGGSPLSSGPLFFSHSVMSNSVTPWTVARQAPLSVGFPRQEYWSGLPFSSPGDLPYPVIRPRSPVSPALAGRRATREAQSCHRKHQWENLGDLYRKMPRGLCLSARHMAGGV